ncbi:hypothetical protein [Culicoidibacter larvae]|uniref:Uncharacterized protein n=1 Tax=Culicoidibacter larvae TaxID=2579976 RepID=A0A5R8QC52_9FIRM|nr:hypothetical protein [Culicoidibacter larvae]TLG73870.1 hypothetical protein FEZ08_06990 [Culicoidibacter larvae]
MKLMAIKREYGFHLTTFYGWLRDEELIIKTERGYEVGNMAPEGMETLESERIDEFGERRVVTQVTVAERLVPELVEKYLKSGLPRLYSNKKDKSEERFVLIERQISILATQLKIMSETIRQISELSGIEFR